MRGESRASSGAAHALRRLLGVLFVAFMVVAATAFVGEANACPAGTTASAAIAAHQMKPTSASNQTSFVASGIRSLFAGIGHSCGNPQSGGAFCQGGCCSTCAAALNVSEPEFLGPQVSRLYAFGAAASLLSSRPSPQFRPPRHAA
jgi:hypothetical protein